MNATHATGELVESTTHANFSRVTPARSAIGRAILPNNRLFANPSKKHNNPNPYTPPNKRLPASLPPRITLSNNVANPPDRSKTPANAPNISVKTSDPTRHGPSIAGNT